MFFPLVVDANNIINQNIEDCGVTDFVLITVPLFYRFFFVFFSKIIILCNNFNQFAQMIL